MSWWRGKAACGFALRKAASDSTSFHEGNDAAVGSAAVVAKVNVAVAADPQILGNVLRANLAGALNDPVGSQVAAPVSAHAQQSARHVKCSSYCKHAVAGHVHINRRT